MGNMHAVSTSQIADILHFNDKEVNLDNRPLVYVEEEVVYSFHAKLNDYWNKCQLTGKCSRR